MESFWQQFITNVQQTKWPEWVSTVAQIASVWYARKNNVLVYPTGIIGVLLAAWLYFFASHPPLYADGTLNIYRIENEILQRHPSQGRDGDNTTTSSSFAAASGAGNDEFFEGNGQEEDDADIQEAIRRSLLDTNGPGLTRRKQKEIRKVEKKNRGRLMALS